MVELYHHPILPYDKCRAMLHSSVFETNITDSFVLTKQVSGQIFRNGLTKFYPTSYTQG
jgi:hypothetical protein